MTRMSLSSERRERRPEVDVNNRVSTPTPSRSRFLSTIYTGDRACKALLIDSWNATVRIQISCIARIRSATGIWDYYTDEDITDGYLVFENVSSLEMQNAGRLPNDLINGIEVLEETADRIRLRISIDSVDASGDRAETTLTVTCRSIHLEDPARPGERIRD